MQAAAGCATEARILEAATTNKPNHVPGQCTQERMLLVVSTLWWSAYGDTFMEEYGECRVQRLLQRPVSQPSPHRAPSSALPLPPATHTLTCSSVTTKGARHAQQQSRSQSCSRSQTAHVPAGAPPQHHFSAGKRRRGSASGASPSADPIPSHAGHAAPHPPPLAHSTVPAQCHARLPVESGEHAGPLPASGGAPALSSRSIVGHRASRAAHLTSHASLLRVLR